MSRRARTTAVLAACAIVSTGCALRVSHERVVASTQGGEQQAQDPETGGEATGTSGTGTGTGTGQTSGSTAATSGGTGSAATSTTGVGGTTAGGTGASPGTSGTTTGRSGATTGTSGAPGTTTGVPANVCKGIGTIRLGNVAPYGASAIGQNYAPGRDVLRIWQNDVNARGGICGRQVEVITEDDGGNASNTSAKLRDLVENKKVSAIIAWGTALTINAGLGYLESKQIPVLGGDVLSPKWSTSPVLFPQGAGFDEVLFGTISSAKKAGAANKMAFLYCAEAQACSDAYNGVVQGGISNKAGVPVTYSGKVSLTAISFASECQQAKSSGADIMFLAGDASFVERVANSCQQQGLSFRYTTTSLAVSDAQSKNPNFQNGNFSVATIVQPWTTTSSAGAKAYAEAYKRYDPELLNSGLAISWWASAELAEKVLTSVGSGPVTPATVLAAARKVKGENLGGLTGALTYRNGGQGSPRCVGVAEVRGGKWVARDNGALTCRKGPALTSYGAG
jgi:branched-chain amino acid transport system substrate-binding protein